MSTMENLQDYINELNAIYTLAENLNYEIKEMVTDNQDMEGALAEAENKLDDLMSEIENHKTDISNMVMSYKKEE